MPDTIKASSRLSGVERCLRSVSCGTSTVRAPSYLLTLILECSYLPSTLFLMSLLSYFVIQFLCKGQQPTETGRVNIQEYISTCIYYKIHSLVRNVVSLRLYSQQQQVPLQMSHSTTYEKQSEPFAILSSKCCRLSGWGEAQVPLMVPSVVNTLSNVFCNIYRFPQKLTLPRFYS